MLTTTSQYALRALVHLARLPEGKVMLGRDLAAVTEIPPNYLSKMLVVLRNAGILETTRGTGGGYRLRKAADEIYLIEVVELFETVSRNHMMCLLNGANRCNESAPCTAHAVWRDLRATYMGFLVSTPLATLAGLNRKAAAELGAKVMEKNGQAVVGNGEGTHETTSG